MDKASAEGAETSRRVYPGPDGKLVYKTTPAGDRIMDFSNAGYMGGGVALPALPVRTDGRSPRAGQMTRRQFKTPSTRSRPCP